jgi:hypothetical protein
MKQNAAETDDIRSTIEARLGKASTQGAERLSSVFPVKPWN